MQTVCIIQCEDLNSFPFEKISQIKLPYYHSFHVPRSTTHPLKKNILDMTTIITFYVIVLILSSCLLIHWYFSFNYFVVKQLSVGNCLYHYYSHNKTNMFYTKEQFFISRNQQICLFAHQLPFIISDEQTTFTTKL